MLKATLLGFVVAVMVMLASSPALACGGPPVLVVGSEDFSEENWTALLQSGFVEEPEGGMAYPSAELEGNPHWHSDWEHNLTEAIESGCTLSGTLYEDYSCS